MIQDVTAKDLVVLAADKQIEFAVRGLLHRKATLGIQNLSFDVFVHPHHDPGCLTHAHEFLRPFSARYARALVMLDRFGSGRHESVCEDLEKEIEGGLCGTGWGNRAAAIVLDPELEIWVWSNSPHVDRILGWEGRIPNLKAWLREQGFLLPGHVKPQRPKEAMEEALKIVKKPRSSAIYRDLAESVSLTGCADRAFIKFKQLLASWFGGMTYE